MTGTHLSVPWGQALTWLWVPHLDLKKDGKHLAVAPTLYLCCHPSPHPQSSCSRPQLAARDSDYPHAGLGTTPAWVHSLDTVELRLKASVWRGLPGTLWQYHQVSHAMKLASPNTAACQRSKDLVLCPIRKGGLGEGGRKTLVQRGGSCPAPATCLCVAASHMWPNRNLVPYLNRS